MSKVQLYNQMHPYIHAGVKSATHLSLRTRSSISRAVTSHTQPFKHRFNVQTSGHNLWRCVFLCVSVSLTALCTNSPCSRADTSQRLGCNYTPLSAPSLCLRKEEKEVRSEREAGVGGGGLRWRQGRAVSIWMCMYTPSPPQSCSHCQ